MTEAEWLQCRDPERLLTHVAGDATPRQLRLLAAAACRRVGKLITDPDQRKAVALVERYADGEATDAERAEMIGALSLTCELEDTNDIDGAASTEAATAVWQAVAPDDPAEAAVAACQSAAGAAAAAHAGHEESGLSWDEAQEAERAAQACLVRDFFGNPFRRVRPNPAWQTVEVTLLARTIYEQRAFARMPELCAALQRAGCHDPEVLNHCRRAPTHARGCWVLDLLLGKG